MASSTDQYTITGRSVVVAAKDQVATELAGEVVILDLKSEMYYGLNAVGARIWALIQEPTSPDQIRDTILAEYEVEPERCEGDILALLQDMAARGLVEVKHETPA